MELAAVGRVSDRFRRGHELCADFCAVSNHAKFSLGKSVAVRNWRDTAGNGLAKCLCESGILSGQDLRTYSDTAELRRDWPFLLWAALQGAAVAGFGGRATGRAESAGVQFGGPKWKQRVARQTALGIAEADCSVADFLSWPLVTPLQLRVAEFSAADHGLQVARHSSGRNQFGQPGGNAAQLSAARPDL